MQALFAALRHTSETPLQCEVVKEAPDDSTVGSFSRFEPALSQQMLEQRVNLHFPKQVLLHFAASCLTFTASSRKS